MSPHKARIAARFAAAAADYDQHSPLQRHAAQRLASQVAALPLPAAPRILEIGCGTGHLTRALRPQIGGDWWVSDIAPAMVEQCRQQHGATLKYLVMDAERPALAAGRFDLIVGSLTAQWFVDLARTLATLADMLAPGGRIALATLGTDSFAEWRAAHRAIGLHAATPVYPDARALAHAFPTTMAVTLTEENYSAPCDDPLDFMRGLRRIGADTPAPEARPLNAGQMRQVLRRLRAQGQRGIGYHLIYAIAEKPATQPTV